MMGGTDTGSRVKFYKDGVFIILHKTHPRKELLAYQIKQIVVILIEDGLI